MLNSDFFRRFWTSLFMSLLMLLTVSAYSQNDSLLTDEIDRVLTDSVLTQTIDKALKARCLDKNQTSVSIVALPSGKVVYTYNALKPLLPASVMKIVTTAAALYYLSPEYRFKTEFLYNGRRKNGSIQGNFIIRGGGDPRLSTEHLWYVATQIKASGINEVTGDLLVDAHFFDEFVRTPVELETEHTQRPYDAKLGALSLNFNSLAVHVQPGDHVGDTLKVWLDPAPAYMHLHNTGKTTQRRGKKNIVSVYRTEENADKKVEIRVRGKLPITAGERVIRLNIDNPMRYTAETFRALLLKAGVKIHGETKIVFTPIVAKKLYEHVSQPLSLILKELNTFSNNFTAEQIVKTIAAKRYDSPGSHAEGLRLIKDFLLINNVNTDGIVLVDGSGLSRQNQFTTQAMIDLLATMYSRFDIGPDFIAALRIMGIGNILSQRLANSPARGKIRAKTGTLNGVSTLAGYVESSNGKVFGYALFLNNNRCGYRHADQIEDRIVTAIHKFGSNPFKYSRTAQR
ncbi:D-alanyl-D-alanine carboxypeptidase/D-alanyl-D-alanine-endopeptidase [Candidatus Parabeggiatoa sp. HSG14]|uniref:D-alanyl-D-alanine carboxypeptidase/D-alanyl-D-alanine endopeptidase n=1 Tax=Candidatus Parabeggiatoa sp. HSG14 TaxID=3055593 RepID=UPI0025A870C5|nr:D-alanyl-D-alanine carboxypeptidase/D-alanyl-D-alanine-endopeptidase [Thiotrichales bacterium HSG14]